MNEIKVNSLLNINETIAKSIFKEVVYPWEVLPRISDFIIELGSQLDKAKFEKIGNNIWIAKDAKIAKTASIIGPAIVDEKAEIRHCAFIRGNAIVGKLAVVGNSTELKNVILFNNVEVPHFNYVGDSILGYKAHMGAGSITANSKSDKSLVAVNYGNIRIETNLRKFGAVLADNVEIGSGCVLNPGTVIGKNTSVYPLSSVRGYVGENLIYKRQNEIINKA